MSLSSHTSSNLLIEVHSKSPIIFSYDAVNIKGKLELVPKDDDYNMFFRLRNAELVKTNFLLLEDHLYLKKTLVSKLKNLKK